MSESTKNSLEKILPQLKCHFTWNLFKEESACYDLEDRVCNQIEFLNTEFKGTMYNLLAYIKHLNGQNEAALENLQEAEKLIKQEHAAQEEIRSLVTWGNYAWVYYHMGRFSKAQEYIDKVEEVCKKFSNPYSIECPELDCEEGWTRLKCGGKHIERAKVCFEKALEEKPNNPEFSSGLAIAMYRLEDKPQKQFCINPLKQAIELSPDNQYIKVLLALKLQKMNEEAQGEQLVKEALEKAPSQTDVLRNAAKFYRRMGDLEKAIELFLSALESQPNNGYLYHQIGCCYRAKIKQMQRTEESAAGRNGKKIEELREYAIDYLKKALEKGINLPNAYSDLAGLLAQNGQHREAEEYYQMAFSKELTNAERQQLHQRYGNFQEYYMKSEDTAVQHYLQGLQISRPSPEREKMKHQLQNIIEKRLSQNAPNSWYLQGLARKMDGDLLQAVECYEKELGRLLRNNPSGIGSLFLPESKLDGGSEEVSHGTCSSTNKEDREKLGRGGGEITVTGSLD
ncbi:interferon-induced protein with tetratricopeptide repeats 3 isoform X2 [Dasypus novemcinctus]|uniref:interferon-induced protein with tetratricopeptide repeats 3 isoform X1 n=1 Tax=Dasypus novemcinctus TaxID=9361 RepID=UPI000329155D|nr:interferon-induced protein with tetratricopeptide repeats 3 isoform X1 [Dasypus novemcinctus]XP_004461478.1 interferon-induced protein with tetratricopeptide repeats 3 isoform X2 [Dasypus novemcinctus]XP_058154788.1 interferon-induced protein with tetratricopeptide repeats 3 isoform X2 [Dasypus novemcinctus]